MSASFLRLASVAATLAVTLTAAATAGDLNTPVTSLKPVQALSTVVGTQQVSGYFVADSGTCRTVLFMATAGDTLARPTVLSFDIGAARTAAIELEGRQALAFGCSVDADRLDVATIDLPGLGNTSADLTGSVSKPVVAAN